MALLEPVWTRELRKYEGMKEIPGKATAPFITKMLITVKAPWTDDATAWCGTAQGAVFLDVGIPIIKNPWGARNWLTFGLKIAGPAVGAIVVFSRPGSSWSGHVGQVVGKDKAGNLMVLGANQRDMVCVSPFSTDRVLGYRWPAGHTLPIKTGFSVLPLLNSNGKPSVNEG